ncbi:hypothetical protein SMD44_08217 [Streptomyces alboflavus]|uniref:Uncharacterized protein n=1 Tax=Streptomyces alboflavus TaxID=67267 RepID=A0A1Z1WQP2_9ACTN|nr:hypothetical protein SMD44_08217 [Streptomyces alboflavus]
MRSDRSTSAHSSSRRIATGHSTPTCLPFSIADLAIAKCVSQGVATYTKSRSPRSQSFS